MTTDLINTPQIDLAESSQPIIAADQQGTVIKITVTNEDVADTIAAGFDRLVVERSTDGGLSFAEVTKASERPVLDKDNTVAVFRDRFGDASYFYRVRYASCKTNEMTDPSARVLGVGLAIRNILSVNQLKQRYFFGTDITDDKGVPLSDAVFQHYILAAIRWFEHQIDIPILRTTFLERHDYYREDYQAFNFIKLDNSPVICINEFRVQYPSGQNVIIFPQEWIRLNPFEGQVQIVPTAGTLSEILVGQGGSFLPAVYNGLANLPHLFEFDYEAGFEDGKVPANILDIIGMFAALGPFNIFGDLIAGAGIANVSLSMDGLSQTIGTTSSATNSGYGARIIQYLKQIKEQIPLLRRYYKGVRFVVA